jgi:short-subunit dehydrogenase
MKLSPAGAISPVNKTRRLTNVETSSSFAKAAAIAGAVAGATWAVAKYVKKPSRSTVTGKVVLITGARGLGLAIARELGRRGARIALCARKEDELHRACESLQREQIEASPFPADISIRSEIPTLVNRVVNQLGSIDVLVNNAGEIRVGPYDTFTHDDFERAMNLMFWAAVNLTFEVLPYVKQHAGHIVNITSVGGRVAVPHLLPYSCAKFALVGFSTGLSAELRSEGVHVLTVVPGLMRTGSHLHAQFTGKARDEFAWFGMLGNLPGFSVAAGYAARAIAEAIEKRQYVRTISLPAKILIASEALLPHTTHSMLAGVNRLLPNANESQSVREGNALSSTFGKLFQTLTTLGRKAAHDLNQ